jgi:hypothetical protein
MRERLARARRPAYAWSMTRDEAEREAERLAREHPERTSYRWFARELGVGVWSVVRVSASYPRLADELEAALEPKRPRSQPDEPHADVVRGPDGPYVGGAS